MEPNPVVRGMATSGTESDPYASKRRKTLETPLPSFGAGKGKSKIENLGPDDGDESELCCGICLLEAGNGRSIIQGCIDSCEHFFCFLCIMEWSKVESRCPMCKRRFSTIRRPPNPPLFLSERLVPVPCRDQLQLWNASSPPAAALSHSLLLVMITSAQINPFTKNQSVFFNPPSPLFDPTIEKV